MKMSIGEKKILFVFGCPNREATVDRLYQVADVIPDPAGKKVVEALADKLDSEGVEKWYRCFFYNMKLEMEAYYRHKAILNRIVGGSRKGVCHNLHSTPAQKGGANSFRLPVCVLFFYEVFEPDAMFLHQ